MISETERARIVVNENQKSLFGKEKLLDIIVYDSGIKAVWTKNEQFIQFDSIEKIAAYDYFASNKTTIISIKICDDKKPIKFSLKNDLYPNNVEANAILSAHRDYLLGSDFPQNINMINLPLGFLGSNGGVQDGAFRLGKNTFPFSDLTDFWLDTRGATGGVYLTLNSIKTKLMIKPEEAVNILASLDILTAIKNQPA